VPPPGNLISPLRILCITAHPDDESVFAGGTLALLAARGAEVRILCCTRGEGGEAGEPPLCTRMELGPVREAELRCAARALECIGVDFLPFRDPDVGPDDSLYAFADSPAAVVPHIAQILDAQKPDILITHGSNGEYGHPAHRLAHEACIQAASASGIPGLLTFNADYPAHPRKRSANRGDPADFVVAIDAVFERKLAALECHRTQQALFVRRPSAEAGHPVPLRETILRRESFHWFPSAASAREAARDLLTLLSESVIFP
jgi:LmbE family N-acetylglucosaminyl deacetylase